MRSMAVVITYHPDNLVYENIRKLKEQIEYVLVVDNSPEEPMFHLEIPGIKVLQNHQNDGMGVPLNQGIFEATEKGYDFLFTFDQDSTVTENYIDNMIQTYDAYLKVEKCEPALISPIYQHPDQGMTYENATPQDKRYGEIETAMTSGNLINVALVNQNKILFREDYFIDFVDHEFCFHIKKEKLPIIQAFNAVLYHSLGEVTTHRLFGKTYTTTNHNPVRRYFITRNRIDVYRNYFKEQKRWIRIDFVNSWMEFFKICCFEKQKGKKILNMFRGTKDGLLRKMGPYRYKA